MKPTELKSEYIRLRAEGQSYDLISEQLHISKSTCTKWGRELASQIDEAKRAELEALCESYGMAKEARIRRLGDTLKKINSAIQNADFSNLDPAKLLRGQLQYMEALKGEYVGTRPAPDLDNVDGLNIVAAFADLLERVRAGEVTTEQAQQESGILAHILKAYELVEIKAKLDRLEAIVGGRPQ